MPLHRSSRFRLLLLAATALLPALAARAAEIPMYIGSYTKPGQSKGIYLSKFNTDTGALSEPELAGEGVSPSFLVQHPTKKIIYCVNETGPGMVSAFAIEQNGKVRELNQQSSKG